MFLQQPKTTIPDICQQIEDALRLRHISNQPPYREAALASDVYDTILRHFQAHDWRVVGIDTLSFRYGTVKPQRDETLPAGAWELR